MFESLWLLVYQVSVLVVSLVGYHFRSAFRGEFTLYLPLFYSVFGLVWALVRLGVGSFSKDSPLVFAGVCAVLLAVYFVWLVDFIVERRKCQLRLQEVQNSRVSGAGEISRLHEESALRVTLHGRLSVALGLVYSTPALVFAFYVLGVYL